MKVIIELNDDMLKEIRESDFGVSRKIVRDFQATIADSIRNGEPISDEAASKECHNENSDYADCDQFVCSNCGIELQDWHQVERDEDDGDITYHEYEFRYCPNCGAKVRIVAQR